MSKKSIKKELDTLINKNRFFRRAVLIWAMWLISWTVIQVFNNIPLITSSVVAALSAVIGILATIVGFYQWMRQKDEELESRKLGEKMPTLEKFDIKTLQVPFDNADTKMELKIDDAEYGEGNS